jgi:hydrogenase maturation protein HypF
MASCLGEHMVLDNAIGVTLDGTGFGTDGKIWGGEFFVGNLNEQRRVAHIQYLPLPGGEVSIKRPYRIALAYLFILLNKKRFPRIRGKKPFTISGEEKEAIFQMLRQERNLVYTSSMGRLFDCVAVLLGLIKEITYEAEAAINLEYVTAQRIRQYYPYTITEGEPMIVELADILAGVVHDIERGVSKEIVSAKFHNTVVHFSLDVTEILSKIYKINKVCFSGGVFQNRYLLNLMIERFEAAGFEVYVHQKLPTNDGCISYGQVILGNTLKSKE